MSQAYKAGYCDAIMGRPYNNTFTGHYSAPQYVAGYLAGKESGVLFFARPAEKVKQGAIENHTGAMQNA